MIKLLRTWMIKSKLNFILLFSLLKNILKKLKFFDRQSAEIDVNSYLWSLDQFNSLNMGEVFLDEATKNSSKKSEIDFFSNQFNKFSRNQSGKNMTAKPITPAIQKLCKTLDDDLSKLLNDIEFTTSTDSNKISSDQQNDDLKIFNEYLQSNLELFCGNLCQSIGDLVKNLRESNMNSTNSNLSMQKILLICRFVHALPNNSFYIKICFTNLINQQNQQLKSKSLAVENTTLNNLLKKKQILNEQKV